MTEEKQAADGALLSEAPSVTIAGLKYELKPLGLRDAPALSRIIHIGQARSGVKLADFFTGEGTPDKLLAMLSSAVGYAGDEVLALAAQMLGVDEETIRDPELFPLSSLGSLVRALAGHLDLQAFLPSGDEGSGQEKAEAASSSGTS